MKSYLETCQCYLVNLGCKVTNRENGFTVSIPKTENRVQRDVVYTAIINHVASWYPRANTSQSPSEIDFYYP